MSSGAWYLSWLVTLARRWLEWQSTDQLEWVHSCGFLSLRTNGRRWCSSSCYKGFVNSIDHFIQLELEATISTKANLCSFLPFFLYYARTKQAKRKNNNNQFQQIKPNPSLLSHFWCCFFNATSVYSLKKTTWPGQCICPPLASTPSLDLETVLAAPGKAIQQNHPSLVKGKNEATENFLEFLSRIHFWPFFYLFQKEIDVFLDGKNMGPFNTNAIFVNLPPVIASSERAFATSGSQGWAKRRKWWTLPETSHNHGSVENGCIIQTYKFPFS